MKRTPLARSTPLQRAGGLHRTPLAPVSRKRARENRERRQVVAAMAEVQQWCSRCGRTGVVIDPDERLSRARGGSITDPDNIQFLCRDCHDWKHGNDVAARAEGWSLSQYGGAA